jgi:hypothetical protein
MFITTFTAAHAPVPRRRYFAATAALLCAMCAPLAHADLIIPTASTVSLGGGSMDLACTDVVISGTLDLQGGSLTNVRNVSINAGGALVTGSSRMADTRWGSAEPLHPVA